MSEPTYTPRRAVPHGIVRSDLAPAPPGPSSLADVLERVLDKGIVIAGDIQVNLLDIELLTIKIRLLVASVDRAKEMGINWWEGDPTLTTSARELEQENEDLRTRLERLEERVGVVGDGHDQELDAPKQMRREVTERSHKKTDTKTGKTVDEGKRRTVTEARR